VLFRSREISMSYKSAVPQSLVNIPLEHYWWLCLIVLRARGGEVQG